MTKPCLSTENGNKLHAIEMSVTIGRNQVTTGGIP